MFTCNLPPALLAERPGYFTCYCGNTGVEQIRNKSQHRKWRRKFFRGSCRDSNPRPFNHESGALTTELSPPHSFQTNKGKRQKSGYTTYKRRSHLTRSDGTQSNKYLYNNNSNIIKNEDHEFIKKRTTVHKNTNIKS